MIAKELRAILDRRPFTPVRIHISSGQHVDVTHPEKVIILPSMFMFAIPRRGDDYDTGWYNLVHVVKVEALRKRRKRRA